MSGRSAGLYSVAMGLCRECGIPESDIEDLTMRAIQRARYLPGGKGLSAAIHTLREEMARQLGMPRRLLPTDLCRLKAIGQYMATERQYLSWHSRAWQGEFDYHSRWFAVENRVCPRCSRRGKFTEMSGRCDCGFAYG